MRLLLTAALAATAMVSSANAAVTLTSTNGTPLTNQIYGVAGSDGLQVFGSAPSNGGPANVTYTGNAALHITNGFAQISDSDFANNQPATQNLFQMIINPNDLFSAMKFSVQTNSSGTVNVYYLLAGSGLNSNAFASYTSCANAFCGMAGSFTADANSNDNHLISGANFDGILIMSTNPVALFQVKQNSYDGVTAAPVPEPATWAMMIGGFGVIGVAARRRRRTTQVSFS